MRKEDSGMEKGGKSSPISRKGVRKGCLGLPETGAQTQSRYPGGGDLKTERQRTTRRGRRGGKAGGGERTGDPHKRGKAIVSNSRRNSRN